MDGSDDVRPATQRHASDPSINEMLRRARDVQLGGHRATNGWWFSGLALLAGILLGALGTVAVSSSGMTARTPQATPSSAPTTLPRATPAPTPLAVPSIAEIVAQVQAYYDNAPPFAGNYLLIGITGIDVQRQDDTQLTACIAYVVVNIASPATLAGGNTRLFTLAAASDGSWQVTQMGAPDSCSLS